MSKLDEIRNKLKAASGNAGGNRQKSVSSTYPFWDIDYGETAVVRFLPDLNEDNTFFWVEKQIVRLTFPYVIGDPEKKPVNIEVPCMETWNETCPIMKEIRPWFGTDMEDTARKFWKKRTYIFQGFVVQDPLNETQVPENPIRKFTVNSQLFTVIKSALLDPDMESMPTDFESGADFRITKTRQGTYANYSTSGYSRKETALTADQRAAIEKHGLFNLADFLPKKPNAEELAALFEMFEASLNGDPYDPERWGKFYRPYGMEVPGMDKKQEQPAKTASKATNDVPWTNEEAEDTGRTQSAASEPAKKNPQDILAMIRSRNTAQ